MYVSPTQYIPQNIFDRRPLLLWAILVSGSLLLVALIIGAPLAQANEQSFVAGALYQTFSHLCHQQPERSYYIAGHQFAVCARCTGIYFGFTGAALSYPLLRSLRSTNTPDRKWVFIATIPLAIDFGLKFLGIWENTHSSRFFTGALLGGVAVFYVVPALAELSQRLPRRSKATSGSSSFSTTNAEAVASAPSDYSSPLRRI